MRYLLAGLVLMTASLQIGEMAANATGYKRSSRDAYIQRLKARRLVTIMGRGELRASEDLMQ